MSEEKLQKDMEIDENKDAVSDAENETGETVGEVTEEETDTEAVEEDSQDEENAGEASENEDGSGQESKGKEPEGSGPGEKKGFFGKKKDKKDKKDQQIEDLTDRLKRQMAEFDNFRKRTEKEKASMYEVGAKSVIEKMLPVVDNFERGLAQVPDESRNDPFVEGMDKIYKQLMSTLEELEVKPIEAVGQEFDPNFHNAVMHVEDEELGENIIAEEFQKGYTYRDTVVRHSMVKVAN